MKLLSTNDTGYTADTIAQNCGIDFADKCRLLAQLNPSKRLETLVTMLRKEVEVLKLEAIIQEKTKVSMDQNQRDYYLREQMKAIREELGEGDDLDECDTYSAKIKTLGLPEEQEKKLRRSSGRDER